MLQKHPVSVCTVLVLVVVETCSHRRLYVVLLYVLYSYTESTVERALLYSYGRATVLNISVPVLSTSTGSDVLLHVLKY